MNPRLSHLGVPAELEAGVEAEGVDRRRRGQGVDAAREGSDGSHGGEVALLWDQLLLLKSAW